MTKKSSINLGAVTFFGLSYQEGSRGAELFTDPDGTALDAQSFAPPGASEAGRAGWVAPNPDMDTALLFKVTQGLYAMRVRIDKKVLPGSALAARVDAALAEELDQTGRKPGAKRKREIKETVRADMLTTAFVSTGFVDLLVWPAESLIAIGSVSSGALDAIMTRLCQSFLGLVVRPVLASDNAAMAMTGWVLNGPPDAFDIDDRGLIEDGDALISYDGERMGSSQDVHDRIQDGGTVTKLAMTYGTKVSFVVNPVLALRSVRVVGVDGAAADVDPDEDRYTTDALLTGTAIKDAFTALLAELSGAVEFGEPADVDAEQVALAASIVISHESASIVLLQREMHLGYSKAARLLAELERGGVVSAQDNKGRRLVLKKG
jgi:recombination associated protein RdgC